MYLMRWARGPLSRHVVRSCDGYVPARKQHQTVKKEWTRRVTAHCNEKNQLVPRSKHSPYRLYKPVS